MTRYVSAALVAAALAVPFGGAARADHTLCDNEPSNTYIKKAQVGWDADEAPHMVIVCVTDTRIVIRPNGVIEICNPDSCIRI